MVFSGNLSTNNIGMMGKCLPVVRVGQKWSGWGCPLRPFIHAVFRGVVRVVRVKSNNMHMCARTHTYVSS